MSDGIYIPWWGWLALIAALLVCAIVIKFIRDMHAMKTIIAARTKHIQQVEDEDRNLVRYGKRLGGHYIAWPRAWCNQEEASERGALTVSELWPDETAEPIARRGYNWCSAPRGCRSWDSDCGRVGAARSTLRTSDLATDTSGYPVYINWSERHLLTIGESDAGKGSILANLLVQAEPFVQSGLVHLYGVDLKALELSMSHEVFRSVATDAKSALELVSAFRDAMTQRAQDMAGKARVHTPTADSPRNILVVDELAELFRQDTKVSKQFQHDLTAILGMGRATGNLLWGFSQNPRKEAIPVRDDFNGQMIAMRMGEAEAKMMLPSAALRVGAAPWAISASSPGTGWLWNSAAKRAQLFRADWIDDKTLQELSATAEA